jgi:CheY-like chemotaxis protein
MSHAHEPQEVILLMAEDDDGHAELVLDSLRETGVRNEILRFRDGEEALDFFFGDRADRQHYRHGQAYLLLLDIRMPRVDGIEVLERLKSTPKLKSLPVIMLTTTDDPREVQRCHELGCNTYVTKPVEFGAFIETLRRLGLFILVIQVPSVNGAQ